jgi:hypothetical protein
MVLAELTDPEWPALRSVDIRSANERHPGAASEAHRSPNRGSTSVRNTRVGAASISHYRAAYPLSRPVAEMFLASTGGSSELACLPVSGGEEVGDRPSLS